MKVIKAILLLSIVFCYSSTFAQTAGKVTVVKSAIIDSLISRRIALTKGYTKDGTTVAVMGYRVQIFFGPDRKLAYSEQEKFKIYYPELGTYISYSQPNYRLKVGDFRSRADAQKLLNDLRSTFPTLFIFNETINPVKADEYNAIR
jgi:hypothetical protein